MPRLLAALAGRHFSPSTPLDLHCLGFHHKFITVCTIPANRDLVLGRIKNLATSLDSKPHALLIAMCRLLSLPNEVLYRIIDVVNPADLDQFSTSCKSIQTLAKIAMERHSALKLKYNEVGFGDWDEIQWRHPIFLLCELISDPRLAYYPTVMRIGEFYDPIDSDDDDMIEAVEVEKADIDGLVYKHESEIRSLVTKCPYIGLDAVREWTLAAISADKGAVLGLLLTILPNIKSITVTEDLGAFFVEMLDRIVGPHIDDGKHKQQALSHVTKVTIAADTDGLADAGDIGMELFEPFALIPSIQSISGSFIRSGDGSYNTFEWKDASHKSNLKEVIIDRSLICGDSLPNFLGAMSNLKRFEFTSGGFLADYHQYQPRRTIAALSKFANHSLEYLCITGCWVGMLSYEDDSIEHCDLRGFRKLRDVHVDHDLFHDNTIPCSMECAQRREICNCHPSRRLVDILPHSIETVKIGGKLSVHRAFVTLDGLPKLKEERLPRLRSVELNSSITARKEVVEACKAVGVALVKSKDAQEDYERQRRAGAADYKDGLL